MWHGANWNFILWGFLHGLCSIFDRITEIKWKFFMPLRWVGTFLCVNILWLLFRSDSISQWYSILKTMILFENVSVSDGLINTFALPETTLITNLLHLEIFTNCIKSFWMLIFIIGAFAICLIPKNNYCKLQKNSFATLIFSAIAFVWSFICLSGESVFVYFNF